MKLSNQAIGALLMTLQKCLAEESDITELLSDWNLEINETGEVVVTNPPSFGDTQANQGFEVATE